MCHAWLVINGTSYCIDISLSASGRHYTVDSGAIPSWLGAAILLGERACVSALDSKRLREQSHTAGGLGGEDRDKGGGIEGGEGGGSRDEHTVSVAAAGHAGVGSGADAGATADRSAYLIPDTIPAGAPEIAASRAVARVSADCLSAAEFYSTYVVTETPVIITGHMTASSGWSGADEWRDLGRLVDTHGAGGRLVPVEFGGFGDRRGTGVIALGDLVRDYLLESNASHQSAQTAAAAAAVNQDRSRDGGTSRCTAPAQVPVAYMSQHALFHQASPYTQNLKH